MFVVIKNLLFLISSILLMNQETHAIFVWQVCLSVCVTELNIIINIIPLLIFFTLLGLIIYFIFIKRIHKYRDFLYILSILTLYFSFHINYYDCLSWCSDWWITFGFNYIPNFKYSLYKLSEIPFLSHLIYMILIVFSFLLHGLIKMIFNIKK